MSELLGGRREGATAASSRSRDRFEYASGELEAMAFAPNYYRGIHGMLRPHLRGHTVEVGAGVGTFSRLLAETDSIELLTLIEPAENNFPTLKARFAGDDRVSVREGYLESCAATLRADALVLINVLEHIEDDVTFMEAARSVLDERGTLLIFVPALPLLFGALDEAFEHHRRYTKRTLRALLENAGFCVRTLRYVNLPGALSWFLMGRVLRRHTLSPRDVRTYDRYVIPWVLRLERNWPPPIGQSLLAIAEPRSRG